MAHAYPPGEWTYETVFEALADTEGQEPLPHYEDEEIWQALAADPMTQPAVARILATAENRLSEPTPRLPASLYLDYTRTGNRTRYQEPESARSGRLTLFALAECFERQGRYLDAVLDEAWAICEQTTWVLPAHHPDEGLPRPHPAAQEHVALRAAGTALLLAELDHLLRERLHPALRQRLRAEVDSRVLTPYEMRDDFWWLTPPTNNWSAVCQCGALGAALYLEQDPQRLARLVLKAAHSLRHYLDDFDADGCSPEGIGYWNYGFGHYTMLARLLEDRSAGSLSLLSPPVVRQIATYPLKVELSPGRYLPFSDADEETHLAPYAACGLGARLQLPQLAARGRAVFAEHRPLGALPQALRNLLWPREVEPVAQSEPPRGLYFSGYAWWIVRQDASRSDGLVVAAKGGHNAESHNHNDCGTFVVHYRGESLLTDLGKPVYDRDFFSSKRYAYLTARSLGHSVPIVNGQEQAAGRDFAAEVVERREDEESEVFAVDLAGCYPQEAGLDKLVRSFTLQRGEGSGGRLVMEDRVQFAAAAPDHRYEVILVSYFPIEEEENGLQVQGERGVLHIAVARPSQVSVRVEVLAEAVRGRDVWRARIGPLASAPENVLRLLMTPTDAP